jgi:uncharacterized RDD family membrane protein YckC
MNKPGETGDSPDRDEHREITVETLSSPPVQIKAASLVKRTLAGILDSIVLVAIWGAIVFSNQQGFSSAVEWWTSPLFAYLAVVVFVYYFFLEGLLGATVGKHLLGLRVYDKNGDMCSFGASFRRNIFRFVDWLPFLYIVGAVAILVSRNRQRFGDRIAGTIVSNAPEKDINPPPAPFLFH